MNFVRKFCKEMKIEKKQKNHKNKLISLTLAQKRIVNIRRSKN